MPECIHVKNDVGKMEYTLCGADKDLFLGGLEYILSKYSDLESENIQSENPDMDFTHYRRLENLKDELNKYFSDGRWFDRSKNEHWMEYSIDWILDKGFSVTVSSDLNIGGHWKSYI